MTRHSQWFYNVHVANLFKCYIMYKGRHNLKLFVWVHRLTFALLNAFFFTNINCMQKGHKQQAQLTTNTNTRTAEISRELPGLNAS